LTRGSGSDGFPTVAITTGTRDSDGTRHTITVACPACHGAGTAPISRPLVAHGGRV
jgi:hypothetical protein